MSHSNNTVRTPGSLDESFADAGIFRLDIPRVGSQTLIHDVAVQRSANLEYLYFAGYAIGGAFGYPYVLGRLMPDGTLDESFGVDGISSGSFALNMNSAGRSIALLADGKILLTGQVGTIPTLARFLCDGTLDSDFGSEGLVILRLPEDIQAQRAPQSQGETQDHACSLTALDSGKILVVHNYVVSHEADTRALIFLLNSDGSADESFNQKGHVQVVYPGGVPADVKLRNGFIDPDGKIVVGGNLAPRSGTPAPFFARYNIDGHLDRTFGDDGFVVVSLPTLQTPTINAMIGQPNKRLLAIGRTAAGQGLLISLEPDGSPNIQFNRGQPLLTRLDNVDTLWRRAAMQPDGTLVLLDKIQRPEEQGELVVARLLSDGSLDTTFNGVGWVSTSLERVGSFDGIDLQGDGKIVIAGFLSTPASQGLVLRYHGRN
ncbi:hypothetical protein [Pseudomonas sp. NPDC087639]|uniref:hypothetical protein n=1 Tax=Pseudomonas sp. NPDC087639 TaxID=3364445 RepID=UPI0038171106